MQEFDLWHYDRLLGITAQQFEQMKKRLHGAGRVAAPLFDSQPRSASSLHQIILGIDPSLRSTGYGVIQLSKPAPKVLAQGTISCPPAWEQSRCLVKIAQTLRDVLKHHHPTVCIIEGIFFAQNLQTAITMGTARGASLLTVAEAGLEVYEIATRKVKQAIVGYGAAQKIAVAKMVQRLLRLPDLPTPDAADALALALTYAQENGRFNLSPRKRL